jgi:cell shape-determining protein MreD
MKISRILAIFQIIIIIYMIVMELTTPYTWKHSIEIIVPSILFFLLLILGLHYKRKGN